MARVIQPLGGQVALVPASIDLAAAMVQIIQQGLPLDRLRRAICANPLAFDVAIIDTPPALDVMTGISLLAANEVIIPARPDFLAVRSVRTIRDAIARLRDGGLNAGLSLRGVLPTLFDPASSHSQGMVDELRALFGDQVFAHSIPYDPHLMDVAYRGRPVIDDDDGSPGASAYRLVARELVETRALSPA